MTDQNDKLTVAISSCPNDTFSFYYLLLKDEKIEASLTEDKKVSYCQKYDPVFLDIEELNLGMLESRWDIVKASFPIGLQHAGYELLPSGAAIGYGVGPIAVHTDKDIGKKHEWVVGLPGENTTANFLWDFYIANLRKKNPESLPGIISKKFMHFSEIMDKTAKGELDLGILIHEGRFVYQNYNLSLYMDLGEFWQNNTGFPVPLGGIFIKKSLPDTIKQLVKKELHNSIENGLFEKKQNSEIYQNKIIPFIKEYSQESSRKVIEQHIETYVTQDTVLLGDQAIKAIDFFRKMIIEKEYMKGN